MTHLTQQSIRTTRLLEAARGVAISSGGVGGRNGKSFRLGAVLSNRSGHILTAGVNSYKTHPELLHFTKYPFIHAEQACMLKWGLDNCFGLTLTVVRIKQDGSLGNSKPCPVCCEIMRTVGIKECIYYDENEVVCSLRY